MPYAPKIVRESRDLKRIRVLPRRKPLTAKTAEPLVVKWTAVLALAASARLKWAQAWAIEEWTGSDTGGVGFLPVGTGKTLLCEVMPVTCKARKAVLIAPAALEKKTHKDRRELRRAWRIAAPPPQFISREGFARASNQKLLDKLKPDLILIDEGDEGANPDASVWQRIARYVLARRAAGKRCRVIILTGTPGRKSIMNYWHFLVLCLAEGAPVPLLRPDAEQWALALDDGTPRQGWRPKPGALGDTLDEAREWYAKRLRETRGVIIVDEDSAGDVPLLIKVVRAPDCATIEQAFEDLARDEETPAGMPVTDTLSLHRIKGQLGAGFFTYYKPPPPKKWIEARRKSAKVIRRTIANSRHSATPIDTEAQAIARARSHPDVAEWLDIKPTYDPEEHSQVEWLSDVTLRWARKWLADSEEPSILWCGWTEFGEELQRLTRLPYYGPKGREIRTRRELVHADPKGRDRVIISSWHANKRGFNLQAWRRHAIVQPPQSAKYLEQLFGRPHRQGQTQPVRFTMLATSGATIDSMRAALSEAAFVKQTASTTQKLLRAKLTWPKGERSGYRWIETWDDDD